VALRYVADLGEREIADVMRISPGTVAATLNAARKRLAGNLAAQGHAARSTS
jgi:DNA-directed RNA polymerase specialized sigma24 family protein